MKQAVKSQEEDLVLGIEISLTNWACESMSGWSSGYDACLESGSPGFESRLGQLVELWWFSQQYSPTFLMLLVNE